MLPTAALMAAVACLPAPDDHPHSRLRRVTVVTAPELLAERLWADGFALHAGDRSAEALAAFDAALRLTPSGATPVWGRALALAALGRHDEAADEYARLLSFDPTDGRLWEYVAYGWVERGRYAEAEACFAEARRWCVSDAERFETRLREALFWCGAAVNPTALKSLRGATGRATKSVNQAFALPPERLLRAEHALTHAVTLDTDGEYNSRADAYQARAGVRFALGRTFDAVRDADHALTLRPADGGGHFVRACLAERQRDADTGLRHLELAAWYGMPPAEVAEKRCDVLTAASRYAEAEVFAREWCRLDPTAAQAFRQHGLLLRVLGKDEEADRAAERAAELRGSTALHVLLDQGMILLRGLELPEAAERTFNRMVERPGLTRWDYTAVLSARAQMQFLNGHRSDAYDDFTRTVRLAPDDATFRRLRVQVAVYHQRDADAIEDADALRRLYPHDPEAAALYRKVCGPEELRAAVAGQVPTFRPAGPVARVPITVAFARRVMFDVEDRRKGGW